MLSITRVMLSITFRVFWKTVFSISRAAGRVVWSNLDCFCCKIAFCFAYQGKIFISIFFSLHTACRKSENWPKTLILGISVVLSSLAHNQNRISLYEGRLIHKIYGQYLLCVNFGLNRSDVMKNLGFGSLTNGNDDFHTPPSRIIFQ